MATSKLPNRKTTFVERKDIHEFLTEGDILSKLYEIVLSVSLNLDTKIIPTDVFNDAYYLASYAVSKYFEFDKFFKLRLVCRGSDCCSHLIYCLVYCLLMMQEGLQQNDPDETLLQLLRKNYLRKHSHYSDFKSFLREAGSYTKYINFSGKPESAETVVKDKSDFGSFEELWDEALARYKAVITENNELKKQLTKKDELLKQSETTIHELQAKLEAMEVDENASPPQGNTINLYGPVTTVNATDIHHNSNVNSKE